jgi:ribosome assembly protein RRB1
LEWSPDDENVICVASGDNTVTIWDMSLEEDADAEAALAGGTVGAHEGGETPHVYPPQLLFEHAGQNEMREARFHSQIPGMIISTGSDSFNIWRPDVTTIT